MKKITRVALFVCLFFAYNVKGQLNVQQIFQPDVLNILSQQPNNADQLNISSITQLGNYNIAKLSQSMDRDLLSLPNSSNSFQQGDFNLVDLVQKGNENVILSFQLGYLISAHSTENKENVPTVVSLPSVLNNNANLSGFSDGNNNTLISSQVGNANRILALQQGNNNYIHAEQVGNENTFVVQQVGSNNKVENFVQNNIHGESDLISQVGDNITLNFNDDSTNKRSGNNYTQNGTNLSITLNNSTLNTAGGIKVNQTGHDMSIVIDQSYFSFPLK